MNTTLLEVTKTARDLISKGKTEGAAARNDEGIEVYPDDPTACKFCMYGAFNAALTKHGLNMGNPVIYEFGDLVRKKTGTTFVSEFSDKSSKEEVLDVFDSVIESLAKE